MPTTTSLTTVAQVQLADAIDNTDIIRRSGEALRALLDLLRQQSEFDSATREGLVEFIQATTVLASALVSNIDGAAASATSALTDLGALRTDELKA